MKAILLCVIFVVAFGSRGCQSAAETCHPHGYREGVCQDVAKRCNFSYVAGYCSGPANINCCARPYSAPEPKPVPWPAPEPLQPERPPSPPPSDGPCSNSTCNTCAGSRTGFTRCAWCLNTNSCIELSKSPSCPSWVNRTSLCPPNPCASLRNCSSCASKSSCYWCATSVRAGLCRETRDKSGKCAAIITSPSHCPSRLL